MQEVVKSHRKGQVTILQDVIQPAGNHSAHSEAQRQEQKTRVRFTTGVFRQHDSTEDERVRDAAAWRIPGVWTDEEAGGGSMTKKQESSEEAERSFMTRGTRAAWGEGHRVNCTGGGVGTCERMGTFKREEGGTGHLMNV